MEKILIIPHHPIQVNLKIRLVEIAKRLSRKYKVYLLSWSAAEEGSLLRRRLSAGLRDVFAMSEPYESNSLNVVRLPMLRRPLGLASKFNSFWLKKFIKKEKIDLVINGSYYLFNLPEKGNFKYIFDIADLPVEEPATSFGKFIDRQIRIELNKADAATVSSRGLVNYLNQNYRKPAAFIPNGADITKLRSVTSSQINAIRRKYNLADKWVIGYIGNIGNWVNLDLITSAFQEIKKHIQNAVLFIVGSCPASLREGSLAWDVIFTGGIDAAEIEAYFSAIDLGVIPSKKSLFQDLAFHVKSIEYTAARKFIVATPAEEIKSLNFPNIIFAKEEKDAWVEAIERSKKLSWDERWDSLVEDYDWAKVSQKFVDIIMKKNA